MSVAKPNNDKFPQFRGLVQASKRRKKALTVLKARESDINRISVLGKTSNERDAIRRAAGGGSGKRLERKRREIDFKLSIERPSKSS